MAGALDPDGRLVEAGQCPSPHSDRRSGLGTITLLVIHNISLPPGEFGGGWIARLFSGELDFSAHPYFESLRGLRVSCHFLISRDGDLTQFVPCTDRAWHAGASAWRGRVGCNDFSVGVELEGADDLPYTERQYVSLAGLTDTLCRAYPIVDIVGHSDIAPQRKTDPGSAFVWARYRAALARVRSTADGTDGRP